MSKTPRVDAAAERGSDHGLGNTMMSGIWPLARQLEQENTALVAHPEDCVLDWLMTGDESLCPAARSAYSAADSAARSAARQEWADLVAEAFE